MYQIPDIYARGDDVPDYNDYDGDDFDGENDDDAADAEDADDYQRYTKPCQILFWSNAWQHQQFGTSNNTSAEDDNHNHDSWSAKDKT